MTRPASPFAPIAKPTPKRRDPKRLKSRPHVIPASVKQEVFDRDSWTCQWCLVPGGALDCHHRLPRSRGGRDIPAHCVSTHRQCHRYIHENPTEAMSRGFTVHAEYELAAGWR